MTANRANRRIAALKRDETPEEKQARLEEEWNKLQDQREELDARIAQIEEELEEFSPPLVAGDIAKNKKGARVKVLEVSPALDSYVARVQYVDNLNKPKDKTTYILDCADLEFVEEAK